MLRLLFSVLAASLVFERRKCLIAAAIVSLAISIALYQAYAQVFLVLAILRLIKDQTVPDSSSTFWKNGVRVAICLICGALLYYVSWVVYVWI